MTDSMRIFDDDCDLLLESIMPTEESFNRRKEVNLFVNDIISKKLHGNLFGVGSYSLMTYLPESDIDLVLITDHGSHQLLNAVFDALYDEIASKDENTTIHKTMTIRNIGLINGRTKVANLMVNNIGVDITVNQTGSLATVTFLEEADRCLGQGHLLKRSIILIKSWCLNESIKYCGQAIIGSKNGMLSAYSITVMVLSLFSKHGDSLAERTELSHPFGVLRKFLSVYSAFNWDGFVVTVDGPVAIQNGTVHSLLCVETKPCLFKPLINQFKGIHHKNSSDKYSTNSAGNKETHSRFQLRACNIQDPIDENNNLGIPVTRHNLLLVEQALKGGFQHLEYIIVYCLWQEQERLQKIMCQNQINFRNKFSNMNKEKINSNGNKLNGDGYDLQHQVQCQNHTNYNNRRNPSHSIHSENSNYKNQQSNDFFITKNEYFKNEEDVHRWESGSLSNEPGTDHAMDMDCSSSSNTRISPSDNSHSYSGSSDNYDRSRSNSDMSMSTPPAVPFVGHMCPSSDCQFSFSNPQHDGGGDSTERNNNNHSHNRNDGHVNSNQRYHDDNYKNNYDNNCCHNNDSSNMNEEINNKEVVASENNAQASFLKAFFSHSYCLYMGPGAFLRSDLRDSPMQYFPFKSRSPQATHVPTAEAGKGLDKKRMNCSSSYGDSERKECRSSSGGNLLEGDINSMWLGLTQAINTTEQVLETPVTSTAQQTATTATTTATPTSSTIPITKIIKIPIIPAKVLTTPMELTANPATSIITPIAALTTVTKMPISSRTSSCPVQQQPEQEEEEDFPLITFDQKVSSSAPLSSEHVIVESAPSTVTNTALPVPLPSSSSHTCVPLASSSSTDIISSFQSVETVRSSSSSSTKEHKVEEAGSSVVLQSELLCNKNSYAKCNNRSITNRQQNVSSIEKYTEVTGIGIENKKNDAQSKTRLKKSMKELEASMDNFSSDSQRKCHNVSNKKKFLTLQNHVSHCLHSLKKNKVIVSVSLFLASFVIASIAIIVIMRGMRMARDYSNSSANTARQEKDTCSCPSESFDTLDATISEEEVNSDNISPLNTSHCIEDAHPPHAEVASARTKTAVVHWIKAGSSISLGFNDANSNNFIGDKNSNSQLLWNDYSNASDGGDDMDEAISIMPLYQWRRDGVNITTANEGHTYLTIKNFKRSDEGAYQYVALFPSIAKTPSGTYQVDQKAENSPFPLPSPSQQSKDLILLETILGISSKPFSKSKAIYVELPVESVLFITVVAEGAPTPTYQWYRNGVLLKGETKRSIYAKSVDSTYSGTYSCELQNIAGKFVWLEATVSIKEKENFESGYNGSPDEYN